tara:strand:+ start:413 stop:694 length:282 start_codon:yes stop_codon:yes gene_type:complete
MSQPLNAAYGVRPKPIAALLLPPPFIFHQPGINQMGNKAQRQNQHVRRLNSKIRKFEKRGWATAGLEKELGFMLGEDRPSFKTGRAARTVDEE